MLSRTQEQQRNRKLIEEYVQDRSEIRATELANFIRYKTGDIYSPIAAARVLGNIGWRRSILAIGSPQTR